MIRIDLVSRENGHKYHDNASAILLLNTIYSVYTLIFVSHIFEMCIAIEFDVPCLDFYWMRLLKPRVCKTGVPLPQYCSMR